MPVTFTPYFQQFRRWPIEGRVICAQFDNDSIVLYHACSFASAESAAQSNSFTWDDSTASRMMVLEPNLLPMIQRPSYKDADRNRRTLALRVDLNVFNAMLPHATPLASRREAFRERAYPAGPPREVFFQWLADRLPDGRKISRERVRFSFRGQAAQQLALAVVEVQDLTEFVADQREVLLADPSRLITPTEWQYRPQPAWYAGSLGLDPIWAA